MSSHRTIVVMAGFLAALAFGGCESQVSQTDVNEARQEAAEATAEADRESQEVRHEARKEIAEVQEDTREEVADLRDEQRAPKIEEEIAETQQEGREEIGEIQREAAEQVEETQEAAEKEVQVAEETAKKFESQQARDEFAADKVKVLEGFDQDIEQLEKKGESLEGTAEEQFDQKFVMLREKRDKAGEALDDLKSATADKWMTHHGEVEKAFNELRTAYDEAADAAP